MKILVMVKEVAEVDDTFSIDGCAIDDRDLSYELNEWDDYAVEEAVQIAEDGDDVEVVAATIGPERAEETIRMVLAKGADRAIRVWDDALAEATHVDVRTKAAILASVVEEEAPDLVLTGVQAADDANSATGVALAQHVDFEWAAVVNALEVTPDADAATVHRELEGGLEEIAEVTLPAVLTIQTGINEPRYASLRGIRQAQRKPIDVQTLTDLGLEADLTETPVSMTDLFEPTAESDAVLWEGEAGETARELATVLREKGVGDA